jgi:hypothetical protein
VSAVLIILGGLYSFVSLMLNQKPEEPLAKLARQAQSSDPNDRDSLVLFAETEKFYAQVPLFSAIAPCGRLSFHRSR